MDATKEIVGLYQRILLGISPTDSTFTSSPNTLAMEALRLSSSNRSAVAAIEIEPHCR